MVGNSGTNELLWFDSLGGYERTTGGRGEGPGEFRAILDIFFCSGDNFVVNEGRRLSFFDAGGGFLGTVPAAGHLYSAYGAVQGISTDCGSALVVDGDYAPPTPGSGIHQLKQVLFWVDLRTASKDTILSFPGRDLYPWEVDGQYVSVRLPFGKRPVWATDGTRMAFASSGGNEVHEFDRSGSLVRIIRWDTPTRLVSRKEIDRFRAEREEFLRQDPSNAWDIPPVGHFPIPREMPTLSRLLIDGLGNLWVRQYLHDDLYENTPQNQQWWVFDSGGEWLGEIRVEAGLEITTLFRETAAVVALDDQDVESVAVFRLVK